MSVSSELQDLANLCQVSAQQNLSLLIAMGLRPDEPAAAAAWTLGQSRLRGQIDRLTALAIELSGQAVVTGLAAANEDLSRLQGITDKAALKIKQIAEISHSLTVVGAVLDLGLAVLTLAGGPTPANALSLAEKAKALLALLQDGADD